MKEKIGIISDTHGLLRPEVLEILKDCKYILHAGDVNKDEILDVLRSMGNLYVVRGNNDKDWAENLRTSLSFTIGGVKFFMVHNKKDVAWKKPLWRRGYHGGDDCGGWQISGGKNHFGGKFQEMIITLFIDPFMQSCFCRLLEYADA